jgi:outer membrane lipoprotein-sorting protein
MSRRVLILGAIGVLLVGGLVAGLVAARAQGSTSLPSITPAELLNKMATGAGDTTSVSGAFTWTNGLLPASDLAGLTGGGQSAAPTSVTSLLMGGSGRLWAQKGSGVRFEAQGNGGDFVVVGGKDGAWTYSSAANTATQITLPAGQGAPGASPSASFAPSPSASSEPDPLAMITQKLQQLAPTATVAVSQEQVAGQQSYILTLTPTSPTTIFGSVKVAVDGTRFVPLRVEVFAKGAAKPALSAGFTGHVSYGKIDASMFTFTPPKGATIKHQTITSPSKPGGAASTTPKTLAQHEAPLTLAQAVTKANGLGLTLTVPTQSSLPASLTFKGAAVLAPAKGHGAVAVLHYGNGFGSVALVETQPAAGQTPKTTLQQQLAKLPQGLLTKTTVNGAQGWELSTSLFNAVVWQQGKVTFVAAGSVPLATITQLTGSLH